MGDGLQNVDLLIVGAGVGGCAAARFAAMGGLEVLLIETRNMFRMAILMGVHTALNRFRPPEKLKLLPQ